jgi:hypothetical protein
MKSKDELQLETLLTFVRDHPGTVAVPLMIWRKMIDKFLPRGQDIQAEERSLFDLIQTVTLSLIHRILEAPTEETKLRGLFITYLQYLDPMYRGSSVAKAFSAFSDPAVAEDVSGLLQAHCREFGGCSVHKRDIVERLERLAATHKRTAERHIQPARMLLINVLGEHLQDLFDLISSATVPAVQVEMGDRLPDLSTLIEQYTVSRCSLAPIAYGIRLSISECVDRLVHIQGERFAIESRHLANHLAGCRGTLAGLPGSGRSTLLRFVAFHGNQEGIHGCRFFYFSARDYLDFAKQGYACCQYIAWQLCETSQLGREHCASLTTEVEELNRVRRLILLVDDVEHLDDISRELVLSKLASATSIFFSVTPRLADVVCDELARRNYNGTLVRLQLDELDPAGGEAVARLAAHHSGMKYVDGSISGFFDDGNAEEGSIPMGIMAAVQTGSAEPATRRLRFGYALFCEFLRRDGYAPIHLPRQADSLDPAMARIIRAGRLAREEILLHEPDDLFPIGAASRMTMSLDLRRLQELWGDHGEDVVHLQIFRRLRYAAAIQVIFPSIEELLMTLDCFYYGGCSKSYLDILLPGSRGPIIQRIRNSVGLVRALFDWQSDAWHFWEISHA